MDNHAENKYETTDLFLRPKWNICVVPVSLPTQNINLLLAVKYLKIGTFSYFDDIFFVKCFNKIK